MSDWDEAEKNFDLNEYIKDFEKQNLARERYERKMRQLRESKLFRKFNIYI